MAVASNNLAAPYYNSPGQNQYTPAYGGNPSVYMPGNQPTGGFPGWSGTYGASPVMGGGTSAPYFGGYPSTPGGGGGYMGGPVAFPGGGFNPYQIPQQGSQGGPQGSSGQPWSVNYTGAPGWPAGTGLTPNPGSENLGHSLIATGLQFPGLSTDFAQYLQSQIGQGITPFNLQTMLPTGGATMPGQLTPGLDPLTSQLANFYMGGGSSAPGANTLSTIANQGISALPEWQAMIQAQQQNINTGAANLKEQMGFMGDLAGSPASSALANYYQQSQLGQNALLGQLQQTNILQGQIPTAQNLLTGATGMGQNLYGYDVNAIQNMYNAFMQASPQNNPMLQYIGGLSTLYPPTTKSPGFGSTFSQALAGSLGSSLGNISASYGKGGFTGGIGG